MKRTVFLGLALAWLGCSSNPTTTDGGADGSTSDASPGDAASDGPRADASTGVDASGALGPAVFPVNHVLMDNQLPNQECGGTNLTSGGSLAATAVVISDSDFSAYVCGDAGSVSTGHAVVIAVATSEYAGESNKSPTQGMSPGTYTIGNQNVPDPDFCMFPPGTNAFLQLFDADDGGAWNGINGTVTVTQVANTSISGSFTTQLQNTDGSNADAGSLTGTFTAPACP